MAIRAAYETFTDLVALGGRGSQQTILGAVQAGGDIILRDNPTDIGGIADINGGFFVDRTGDTLRCAVLSFGPLTHAFQFPLDTLIEGTDTGPLSVVKGVLTVGGAAGTIFQRDASLPYAVIVPIGSTDRMTVGPQIALSENVQFLINADIANLPPKVFAIGFSSGGTLQTVPFIAYPRGTNQVGISINGADAGAAGLSAEGGGPSVDLFNTILKFAGNIGWEIEGGVVPPALQASPTASLRLKRNGVVLYLPAFAPAAGGVPIAPSNLTATAVSTTQINLGWSDNSSDETSFRVERSSNGTSGWTEIASTAPNTAVFNNTGLTPNTTYYYQVRARNAVGDSGYTNVANAQTQASGAGVLDHFTGADGTLLTAHTSDSGHAWTVERGNFNLSQNAGHCSQSNPLAVAWISGQANDGTVTCTLGTDLPGSYVGTDIRNGLHFRFDGGTQACMTLLARQANGSYILVKYVNGVEGTISATINLQPAIGDKLKVQFTGTTWNVWIDQGSGFVQYVSNLTIAQDWPTSVKHGICTTWNSGQWVDVIWDDYQFS